MMRAVVFAYHNVGVRCLQVLLARGVDVTLVVTHEDNPAENIWFESVAQTCQEHGLPCITPAHAQEASLLERVEAEQPDMIFSFYYRHMLPAALLALAPRGAYNLHGSLLPKYRGRVPANWAVLHGESETGVTLHEMVAKPDAGAIVAQVAVPILPDDTAYQVFGKLTVASEQALWTVLPALVAGTAPRWSNDLSQGSYFGGRTPEDGRIDWTQPAQTVYNLHRAVAPPYPGAWTMLHGQRLILQKARLSRQRWPDSPPGLMVVDHAMLGVCGDAHALLIQALTANGQPVSPDQLQRMLMPH